MESNREEEEERVSGAETKEEDEGPLHDSASHELLLLKLEDLLPESHRLNSPSETRLLAVAGSFQRQYSHLYPSRKPLLLCPLNECGVQKFVSTTLRAAPPALPELFTWRGCASFVADFLSLEPLEPPVDPPRFLPSSSLVLQSQRASCLASSTLLCSLLLGNNYDSYCVSGYAVREVCVLDRSALPCPLLDAQVQSEVAEQEPQENKYLVKLLKEQKSRFLTQQEEKKKRQEAEKQTEQERPADPLRGLRVHCWVLVLSGSRVQENFFIDPLSGSRFATDHEHFLGVESVWNHLNYYVNMQDCSAGCADMTFDLEDLKTWEPVLYGAISKKQLLLDVSKKKEIEMMSKMMQNPEEEEKQRRVFEMPRSWISSISISKEDLERRWPGRQKVTRYREAKLEEFAPYLMSDGLVQRLTAYQDLDCTEEVTVKEWYQHREDHLEEREVNKVDSFTTERFTRGRRFHLLLHRFSSQSGEREMFFSSAHMEDLVRRLLLPGRMTETFEGRKDFLFYRHVVGRHVVFNPQVQLSGRDRKLDVRQLKEVVERFHRNRSKPAYADVAERVFLLAQSRIEVTYHLEDDRFIAARRSFVVPTASQAKKAEDFTHNMVQSFQVDPSQEPLKTLTLSKMLVDLIKDQKKMLLQIQKSHEEVLAILACREQEERDVGLHFSPWTSTGAVRASNQREDMERQAAEEQVWLQERKKDFLAPHLIRLDNPETLSAADAKRLYQDCVKECKQRLVDKADLIQKLYEKETQELQMKQQWYQKNQGALNELQQDEYHNYCSEKTLQIHVAKKRLSMHMTAAPLELQNFNLRLRNDPRLAPHLPAF